MRRRSLLKLGLASSALFAGAGVAVLPLKPGLQPNGQLTESGRAIFGAVARAVLEGVLPIGADENRTALQRHLDRLDAAIAAFPAATRVELSQLLAVLARAPGRLLLAGLRSEWHEAEVAELQVALQSMRESRLELRQQIYHALRDLTNAAYFADAAAWPLLGYPAPQGPA